MKGILFVLVVIGIIQSCKPNGVWGIRIKNNTSDTVVVTYGMKLISKHKWEISAEFPEVAFDKTIKPNHYVIFDFPYASYKEIHESPQDTFSIFIIDPKIVREYTWKEIGEKEMFLHKYTKTMAEFKAETDEDNFFVYSPDKE